MLLSAQHGVKRSRGDDDENVQVQCQGSSAVSKTTLKKTPAKRKKRVTAKSLNIPQHEFDMLKIPGVKRDLKEYTSRLASMVNADWHDGYEAQGEKIGEFENAGFVYVKLVFSLACQGKAIESCHEVMKCICDSIAQLLRVPMRGGVEENMGHQECKMGGKTHYGLIGARDAAWTALLLSASASSDVDESMLCRMLKDVHDNDAWDSDVISAVKAAIESPVGDKDKDGDEAMVADAWLQPGVLSRLTSLQDDTDKWQTLPSTVKSYKMRRAIDRRYDGSPSRRTRDFGDMF